MQIESFSGEPKRTEPSYSLWLVPDSQNWRKVCGITTKIACQNETPLFDPHVTLISDLTTDEATILATAKYLADNQQPFNIRFNHIGMTDQFFKAAFLETEQNPYLMGLHKAAKAVFQAEDTQPYQPHLSLLYGIFDESRKKGNVRFGIHTSTI